MSRKNDQCNVNKTAPPQSAVTSNLSGIRRQKRISAALLAERVAVSRQTIYAIESGTYVPNTAVALRLARVLDVPVESLFALPEESLPSATEQVKILPSSEELHIGQPVNLCSVGDQKIGCASSFLPWSLPIGDAVLMDSINKQARANVKILGSDREIRNRILIAGCDPAVTVLARHLRCAGIELVLAHRNSAEGLTLLKRGYVHLAGTHQRTESNGDEVRLRIREMFPADSAAIFSFAVWEAGIITAKGNPKRIRGLADLARKDVSIVNREKGAGSRVLLDSSLKRLDIPVDSVRGYECIARGHLAAAWQVQAGLVNACIAPQVAARVFGLHFVPLASERYDLVIGAQHLDLPNVQALCDTLCRAAFRRDLEGLSGYDVTVAGNRVL